MREEKRNVWRASRSVGSHKFFTVSGRNDVLSPWPYSVYQEAGVVNKVGNVLLKPFKG